MGRKCVGCDTPIPAGGTKCPMCGAPAPMAIKVDTIVPPSLTPKQSDASPRSSEKKCRSCAMMVPKDAVKCPFCRSKIGMSAAGKVIAALFILMVISAVIGQTGNPPPVEKNQPTAQDIERAQGSDAKYMAKEFITGTLKAPSTAKFQSYNDFAAAKQKDGSWQVLGYVDAQNSFGAMLRQQFLCTLKKTGDKWQVVDLKMPY